MFKFKEISLLILIITFAVGAIYSPATANVVLRVNDEELTEDEYEQIMEMQMQQMEMQMQQVPEEQRDVMEQQMRQELQEQLVQELALVDDAKQSGIEVTDEDIEEFLAQQPGAADLEMIAEQHGMSEEEVREQLKDNILIETYIDEEIDDIDISEAEKREFYEQNQHQFTEPEQVEARHILLDVEERGEAEARELGEELRTQLEDGADFCELAAEYSDGPTADDCGELGFFSREEMVPEFSEAAFDLAVGEFSEPVQSDFGFHVIEKLDHQEEGDASFEDVRADIEAQLEMEQEQQQVQQHVMQLVEEAEIERNFPDEVEEDEAQPMMPEQQPIEPQPAP